MKVWIKFLLLPLIFLTIFSLLEALIMGYLFKASPNGWGSWVSSFIVMWFVGGNTFMCAPTPRIALSMLYSGLILAVSIYLDAINDGHVVKALGEVVQHQFNLGRHIASGLGLLGGIASMYQHEQDNPQNEGVEDV